MMTYILIIWTSVASSGYMGWRPIGEFNRLETCNVAGSQLTLPENRQPYFRCLKK